MTQLFWLPKRHFYHFDFINILLLCYFLQVSYLCVHVFTFTDDPRFMLDIKELEKSNTPVK